MSVEQTVDTGCQREKPEFLVKHLELRTLPTLTFETSVPPVPQFPGDREQQIGSEYFCRAMVNSIPKIFRLPLPLRSLDETCHFVREIEVIEDDVRRVLTLGRREIPVSLGSSLLVPLQENGDFLVMLALDKWHLIRDDQAARPVN